MPDLVAKQWVSVVDKRTTIICLFTAGQIRNVDEPFDTPVGQLDQPPAHIHCRATVAVWVRGFVNEHRKDANAEIIRRGIKRGPSAPEYRHPPMPPPIEGPPAGAMIPPRDAAWARNEFPASEGAYRPAAASYEDLRGRLPELAARSEDVWNSDPMLRELAREQGFDGLPELVDDLGPYIRAGEQELLRGVGGADYVEAFKTGDYWAGQGVYGNGTYTVKAGAQAHRTMESYEALVRMTLRDDAKVITLEEAEVRMDAELDRLGPADPDRPSLERRVLLDPGKWAAANGYDAIDIPRKQWMVVLNRTAVRVQRGKVTP